MDEKDEIILRITEIKTTKQQRINIPKKFKKFAEGDFVKVIKVELK